MAEWNRRASHSLSLLPPLERQVENHNGSARALSKDSIVSIALTPQSRILRLGIVAALGGDSASDLVVGWYNDSEKPTSWVGSGIGLVSRTLKPAITLRFMVGESCCNRATATATTYMISEFAATASNGVRMCTRTQHVNRMQMRYLCALFEYVLAPSGLSMLASCH